MNFKHWLRAEVTTPQGKGKCVDIWLAQEVEVMVRVRLYETDELKDFPLKDCKRVVKKEPRYLWVRRGVVNVGEGVRTEPPVNNDKGSWFCVRECKDPLPQP